MKRTIEIRFQLTVEVGSFEEAVLDFIRNKQAAPHPLRQMVMMPLIGYWLPPALQYKGLSTDKIAWAVQDVAYHWLSHHHRLQHMTGIELNEQKRNAIGSVIEAGPQQRSFPAIAMAGTTDLRQEEAPVGEADSKPVSLFQDSIIVH